MSSEAPLTTELVEDRYAYDEWDVDAEESEKPRRERFRRWLTAELAAAERRGAVRALREAAEEWQIDVPGDHERYARALLVRADRMEAGDADNN